MLYWQSLLSDSWASRSLSLNVMLYWQSLLPDSWHHDRQPSMSCSIGSISSLTPGHHDRLPSMSRSIGSLSSLIPGITIAFPQCHALLAVSPL